MAVSDRDRDHMRRLGELKAAAHADASAAHLALSPAERLARSMTLMRRFRSSATARVDDPTPFYDLARRLGLYRP